MSFILSKLFWVLARPLNGLLLLAALGALLRHLPRAGLRKIGTGLIGLAMASFLLLGFTTLPDLLLRPLEDTLPARPPLPANPAGIIILGGAFDMRAAARGDGLALNGSGDRVLAGALLARRFPGLPVIYTGGVGRLRRAGLKPEAPHAAALLRRLLGEPFRLVVEDRSRTTWENALRSRELLKPTAKDVWIVVTSAFHALRGKGSFEKAGFHVVMWPTDYRADATGRWFTWEALEQMGKAQLALKEYAGIIAYTLMGRMDWPW